MIVAAAANGIIGVADGLPWHIPGDLRRFKKLTMGGAVIMGRSTFESIGRPLPGRTNIVLSRREGYRPEGVVVVHDAVDALVAAREASEPVFVIGGGQVYREMIADVDRIELTVVDVEPEGDTILDPLDASVWRCVEHHDGEGDPPHRFHTLWRAGTARGDLTCLPDALVRDHSPI